MVSSLSAHDPSRAGADLGGGERPNPCGSSWIVLVCLLVWMHGATFGATLGDGVLKPLLILTLMFFAPIFALWSLPAMRRLLVALWYSTTRTLFALAVCVIGCCCFLQVSTNTLNMIEYH